MAGALQSSAGATELTDIEKVHMTGILKSKYADLVAANQKGEVTEGDGQEFDVELFQQLSKVYAIESKKLIEARHPTALLKAQTPRTPLDTAKFQMLRQQSKNYFGEEPTPGMTFIFDVADAPGGGAAVPMGADGGHTSSQKTSFELIEALRSADQSVLHDQDKVKKFVEQLKKGEVKTKKASNFRKKRLTYENAPHESAAAQAFLNMAGSASAPTLVPSTMQSQKSVKLSAAKLAATIFAADEIGAIQDSRPPFPSTVVGVFSCHGVAPGEDSYGDEVVNDKINQDRGCVVCPYRGTLNECLFMVLDGHGDHGDRISEFTMRQIAISLEKHPALEMDPVTALKETFVNTNTALLVTPMNFMTSGTTCVAAYYANNTLFVANCGDSRAVVAVAGADGTLTAQELSRDHKPDDPIEQARIEASGGFVSPPPRPGLSARVYLDQAHTMIGLAMARSIGDYAVKGVGVTAEPEVKTYPVDESYQFLIMASDGVWEFMSSQVRGVLWCGVP